MPDDSIEITTDERTALLQAESSGKVLHIEFDKRGVTVPCEVQEKPEHEKYADLIDDRNKALSKTDWIINRHRDQKDLNKETTITEDEFLKVLQWQDDLRNLPQRYKTSDEWVWPTTPASIKGSFNHHC